jgi:hypothetical protein
VWFKGSPKFIVRDITDILHPVTVSHFDEWGLRFVNASELSYGDRGFLYRMPLSGSPKSVLAECAGWSAWSPDGRTVAYISNTAMEHSELHLVGGGQNRVVASMGGFPLTGCETRWGCEHFSVQFSYSPNGSYISLVSNIGGPAFRLWTSDGKLLKAAEIASVNDNQANPSSAVWSGTALYWRDAKGVEMWRDGAEALVLPGMNWITPMGSPGGGQIVFQTRDGSGTAHINLLDTRSGKFRELVRSRSGPIYLNSHLIWYVEERSCVPDGFSTCSPESKTIETGRTFIYDLQDNTETESVIAAVFDVWPHGA